MNNSITLAMQGRVRQATNLSYNKLLGFTSSESANDFIVPITLHKGSNVKGISTGRDLYLDNKCKSDFSDVIFEDESGNLLDNFITNVVNNETQYDNSLPTSSIIINDTTVLANRFNGTTNVIAISYDNCVTWTTLFSGNSRLSFIDSHGYYYITDIVNHCLKRSIDLGVTWTTVYTMTYTSGLIEKEGITEDISGNIFIGIYQNEYNPIILKSTDGGASFTDVFSANTFVTRPRNISVLLDTYVRPSTANGHLYKCTVAGITADTTGPTFPTTLSSTVVDGTVTWKESGLQHVHNITADPHTGYIYATFDGDATIFRSIDSGATWNKIYAGDHRSIICGNGFRLFGAAAYSINTIISIVKTTDDINFYSVLENAHSVQDMVMDGSVIYANTVSYSPGCYPSILKSPDNGENWETIWQGIFDSVGDFNPYGVFSNVSTLSGEKQFLCSGFTNRYPYARLYVGGNHYQATAYIKTKSLSQNIRVRSGKISNSQQNIFLASTLPSPLLRVKFNEGIGVPADSISSPHATTLTGTGSWVNSGGRFASPLFPKIFTIGKTYKFNGDGVLKITGSESFPTANFSAFCWFKTNQNTNNYACLFGNLSSYGCALMIRLNRYYFYYDNYQQNGPSIMNLADNKWHMAGIIVDNSSPAKISFIHDGLIVNSSFVLNGTNTIANPITPATTTFKIGASGYSTMANFFTGEMSDVQLYSGVLTPLQVRSIFEDRPLLSVEPTISV